MLADRLSATGNRQQAIRLRKIIFCRRQTATIYATADSTDWRLTKTGTSAFRISRSPWRTRSPYLWTPHTYQEFVGIGAALTDAAAETYYKLPKERQQELIKAYFDKDNGIGYTIGRTNINSCDFSSDMYTYVKRWRQVTGQFFHRT